MLWAIGGPEVSHRPTCPWVGAACNNSDQALSVSKSRRCPHSTGLRAPISDLLNRPCSGPWGPSQPTVLSSLCTSLDICLLGIWISVSDQRANTWAPRVPRGLCPSQGERAPAWPAHLGAWLGMSELSSGNQGMAALGGCRRLGVKVRGWSTPLECVGGWWLKLGWATPWSM